MRTLLWVTAFLLLVMQILIMSSVPKIIRSRVLIHFQGQGPKLELVSAHTGDEFIKLESCKPDPSVIERGVILTNATKFYGRVTSDRISSFLSHPRWLQNGGDYWMAHIFRLQVVNNTLYLSHLPGNDGVEEKRKHMHPRMYHVICYLQRLLRKVQVSDTDFLVYIGDLFDWDMLPYMSETPELKFSVPLFVQEKTKRSNTFLIHPRSFDGFEDALRIFNRSIVPEWGVRLDKAVWRGSTTGGPGKDYITHSIRTRLVRISKEHPELIDARFTNCQLDPTTCKEIQRYGMMGDPLDHVQQLRFKMIVMVDGNSLPDRFAHQLASGSVILKQESPHEEFWYKDAIPWVHYIPVAEDLSNLVDRIRLGLENQTLLQSISTNGRSFIIQKMTRRNIDCLWVQLLQTYCHHLDHPIQLADGFLNSHNFCRPPMS